MIISAIHEHGGDVLKLIGGGTLAIFTAEDRLHACNAALSAAIAAREGVAELNEHRAAKGRPLTDMYLGLHVGNVSLVAHAEYTPSISPITPSAANRVMIATFGSYWRAILI